MNICVATDPLLVRSLAGDSIGLEIDNELNKLGMTIFGIVSPILCLFALISNIVTLIMLRTKDKFTSATFAFFIAMLSSHCATLIAILIHFLLTARPEFKTFWLAAYIKVYVTWPVLEWTANCGYLLAVSLILERFDILNHMPGFCANERRQRVIFTCKCIFIIMTVISLPTMFTFAVDDNGCAEYRYGLWQRQLLDLFTVYIHCKFLIITISNFEISFHFQKKIIFFLRWIFHCRIFQWSCELLFDEISYESTEKWFKKSFY